MVIGVLALQGAFALHRPHIEAMPNCQYFEVSKKEHLEKIDALILPGGESSVMLKLIELSDLKEALQIFFKTKPVWGICAGAILMASKVTNPDQFSFKAMNYEIERNSYGRQNESFFHYINDYEVSFIRAPKIKEVSNEVTVKHIFNNSPTWVESTNKIATMFHPETNKNYPSPWHINFLNRI